MLCVFFPFFSFFLISFQKVGAALSMTYVTGQPIIFVGCGQVCVLLIWFDHKNWFFSQIYRRIRICDSWKWTMSFKPSWVTSRCSHQNQEHFFLGFCILDWRDWILWCISSLIKDSGYHFGLWNGSMFRLRERKTKKNKRSMTSRPVQHMQLGRRNSSKPRTVSNRSNKN